MRPTPKSGGIEAVRTEVCNERRADPEVTETDAWEALAAPGTGDEGAV